MDSLKWIMSEGGALLAMEARLQPDWGGICRLTIPSKNATNDYERVPTRLDFIEPIDLLTGQALVFGEGPLDTAFWSAPNQENFIVRIIYCNPDFDADSMMRNFDQKNLDDPDEELYFRFFSENIVIFDSSEDGSRSDVTLICTKFDPGYYKISSKIYQPNDQTCSIIHRFRMVK